MVRKLDVQTRARTQTINITAQVQEEVRAAGLQDGLCSVYVPHTTAGVFINEGADPSVMEDLEETFDRLVPWNGRYRHSEGNAAAHVKATLVGESVTVLVENGKLQLGTWQAIFFAEFDGPRRRTVWVGTLPAS
jgi:secondary thiamine-phosphate synthase enzyme